MKRVGVDVGGTFTDLIYVDDEAGVIRVHKLPTTPGDPSQGTVQGIEERDAQAGESPSALDSVFHGTTIATNIVIEHNGATVGMITTEGYRDILHIARHKKPLNFSNYQDLPWQRYPVVRRRYRLTVPERMTRDGSVLVPLDEDKAREQVLRAQGGGRRRGRRLLPVLVWTNQILPSGPTARPVAPPVGIAKLRNVVVPSNVADLVGTGFHEPETAVRAGGQAAWRGDGQAVLPQAEG